MNRFGQLRHDPRMKCFGALVDQSWELAAIDADELFLDLSASVCVICGPMFSEDEAPQNSSPIRTPW
jgi:hypothetical protein